MAGNTVNGALELIAESLELPDSAYEKAKTRYEDLGQWFGRKDSRFQGNKPQVSAQGSFRLGTAIPPINAGEEYDLDLGCLLSQGISKQTHTQANLKLLIGLEIEDYRLARKIKSEKEEKHRCWRLHYEDALKFHLDVVPCIPDDEAQKRIIRNAMQVAGTETLFSEQISNMAVSITDDRRPEYRTISSDWLCSNPEGYAQWFESRMRLADRFLRERAKRLNAASVNELPNYTWKTPLQRCVQLLKRHRDQMFNKTPDLKPVSVILTSLAARAYEGEADIEEAMKAILTKMPNHVGKVFPRVPNPVDPREDFADRWAMPECRSLNLEKNFYEWLHQARRDFDALSSAGDAGFISEQSDQKLKLRLNSVSLKERLNLSGSVAATIARPQIISTQTRPWCPED